MKCGECRHWALLDWDEDPASGRDWKQCGMARQKGIGAKRSLALAHGGDLDSYLFTSSEFGCIQFEAKGGEQ